MNDTRTNDASLFGRIVWHDLLTHDVDAAKHFYAALLGWDYQIEHATDSAWQPGEADYSLIIADGVAHGGFVDPADSGPSRWLAYVRVPDVDVAATKATALGATIAKAPFDVPGVGRSAVITDFQGAMIAVHVPTHGFPPPEGTFLTDELATNDIASAEDFYAALFGWWTRGGGEDHPYDGRVFKSANGSEASRVATPRFEVPTLSIWLPYLAVDDVDISVDKAGSLGADLHMPPSNSPALGRFAVLSDPTGAMFALMARGANV